MRIPHVFAVRLCSGRIALQVVSIRNREEVVKWVEKMRQDESGNSGGVEGCLP